jgi:hypothetical protein
MIFKKNDGKKVAAFYKNKHFLTLSYRLELFTSIIPIPSYVYFVAVVGAFKTSDQLRSVAISGFIAGIYTVLWGLIYRFLKMKSIFLRIKYLEKEISPNQIDIRKLKTDILNYPYKEVNVIISRWLLGCTTGIVFYYFLQKEIPIVALIAMYSGLIFVLPISSVMYLFETELQMKEILENEIFHGIEVDKNDIQYLGYFLRILLSVVAVAITPMSIMGFIIYSMVAQTLLVDNPIMHIVLLSAQSIFSMLIVSYTIAKSVKSGLAINNETLKQIGQGNFFHLSSRSSGDEFGDQGYMIGVITSNLRNMYDEIMNLNHGLEKKVEARTKDLQKSIEEIQKLKVQQDGDYFLTSLLTKPLYFNANKSESVKTEFIIKQKKKFSFKNREADLGGDICVTGNLKFRSEFGTIENYTMAFNGDAMGKSMQGAGGSIVMGVVLNSIMERSASNKRVLEISPAKWLTRLYREVHSVFKTFNGSMVISGTVVLINDDTGITYYWNAEHPYSVLYKDKKASYIEKTLNLRKLGLDSEFQFKIFQMTLRDGDSLIMGSDGRDDILISKPDGQKGMNEDDLLFLNCVEKANGDIYEIYNELASIGEITDDLSLLRIEYHRPVKSSG